MRFSLQGLLTLEAFGHAAFELFQGLGGVTLQGGFAIGVFLAADAVVGESQLIMSRWAVWRHFFVGFQRRNGLGELLTLDKRGTETEIGFRKAGVDLGGGV